MVRSLHQPYLNAQPDETTRAYLEEKVTTSMSIIVWLLLGIVAGWLAGLVMGGGRGILGNIVVGVLGAMIGGFLGSMLLGWDVTGFNLGSILLATLGAVLLVMILRAIPGRQPLE